MLTLSLEPTDDGANPAFKDEASCNRWLSQLQLTNLQQAHAQLLTQIKELNRLAMPVQERFKTLEALRETVGHIQSDLSRKLIAKPLPLIDAELTVLATLIQLWQAMLTGYLRGLRDSQADEKQLARSGAALCHRSIAYSGLIILEYLRVGYECNPRLWSQLHDLYAYAEEHELLQTVVPDVQHGQKVSSCCRDMYIKTLLLAHARPAELSRSQLQLLDQWLGTWGSEVVIAKGYSASKGDAQPLAIDLSGGKGLQSVKGTAPGDQMRYLAMVPLSKLLRIKIILLQQDKTPKQVGLGEMINGADCIKFLNLLHRFWCDDPSIRMLDRQKVEQPAQLCSTTSRIYSTLSGKTILQPGKGDSADSIARKQIETFGRVLDDSNVKQAQGNVLLESWIIDNESMLGARLTRAGNETGRMSAHQLVAVRPGTAGDFKLAGVAWLQVTHTGRLQIGVSYLPGVPEAVTIRATGVNLAATGSAAEAFLLPAMSKLGIPASLVVPRDWFHAGRVIEVTHANLEKKSFKLGFSVEAGHDYERVSFMPV